MSESPEQYALRLDDVLAQTRLLMAEIAERRFNMPADKFATYLCKEAAPKFFEITEILKPSDRYETNQTMLKIIAEATNPAHKEKVEEKEAKAKKVEFFENKIVQVTKRLETIAASPMMSHMVPILERERDKYIEMLAQL